MKKTAFDIDADQLKVFGYGRWLEIIPKLTNNPQINKAILMNGKYVDCPFPEKHHQSRGRKKFRLMKNKADEGLFACSCGVYHPINLIREVNNWDFFQTLQEVNEALGDPCNVAVKFAERDQSISQERKDKIRKEAEERMARLKAENEERTRKAAEKQKRLDEFRAKTLHDLWSKSLKITSKDAKVAWRYLFKRGVDARVLEKVSAIRFHPDVPHYVDGELKGRYPAILSLYTDKSGRAITIHRTYLDAQGNKANLEDQDDAKLLMPYPSDYCLDGGSIKLMEFGEYLGVSEGIENALAVIEATEMPTWPTYSAAMLERIDLVSLKNKGLKKLFIWEDKDRSKRGEEASVVLAKRCEEIGLAYEIMSIKEEIPEGKKGIDWEDVLVLYGPEAFPDLNLDLAA